MGTLSLRQAMKTLHAETLARWREWLDEHQGSEPEVWLVFYKRHTGVVSLHHPDALDEALCFGWVDSLVKRLDDRRYAVKFTPRREDSRWSTKNRQRLEVLKAGGRLKPAGVKRPPTDRGHDPRPARLPLPSKVPAYTRAALSKRRPARLLTAGNVLGLK